MLRTLTKVPKTRFSNMGVALFASRIEISHSYSTHEAKQQSRQERVATLFHVNQLCQLSSYKACGETPSGVHTSVLPYAVLTRNQSDEIFAEFANPTKITEKETNSDAIKANKSDAVVEHENKVEESIPYDKSTHLQHYDIVFCSKADSQHVSNLESSPHPFVGPAADIPNNQTALISLTVGHARSEINQRFSSASRFPPRAVLVAKTEMVPHGSKAASLLWTNYFRQHPNVSNKLRRDDVRFYRISSIRSAQFIDLSGKLAGVESLPYVVSFE